MNITIFIIEAVVLTVAFTGMILIPLNKDSVWWIHDYPKDIQEEYFKTHERIPSAFFSKTVLLKKGFALLVALAFFVGLIWLAGAQSFLQAFIVSYGLWLITFADVDKEYANALNYGAKPVLPPTTEPWGQRTCYVADPDGNLIEIGSFEE